MTALMKASSGGDSDKVRLLLDAGADALAKDNVHIVISGFVIVACLRLCA